MIAACSRSSSSNCRSPFLSGVFCKEAASAVTFLDLGEGEARTGGGERGREVGHGGEGRGEMEKEKTGKEAGERLI
jgi:hypothetical protein